ncbi:MAG: undecaprenyl phosphate translocase family protein [Bacilli bacterium]
MKNFHIGFIIGLTSLIPGISAGTIIYISDEYTYITSLISNFKKSIKELTILFTGILLGVLSFSKIIEFLFFHYYSLTMFILVLIMFINFLKVLPNYSKLNLFYIFIGIIIIYLTSLSNNDYDVVITNFPKLTIPFLILFSVFGFIDGFLTITPGISGSMVMMILGPYYLYKSYLANLTKNIIFALPLLFYFLGDLIGIIIGSKISLSLLKKHPLIFNNIIIGMVIASIIILIPIF